MRVTVAQRAHELIVAEARRWRDGLETGGPLFSASRFYSDRFYVAAARGLGPGARRGANSFGMDHVQALTSAHEFRRYESAVREAGHWPTHLATGATTPSTADLQAWARLAGLLERGSFLALIVTPSVDPGDRAWTRPKITPWVLRTGPLGSWVCEQAPLVS